MSTADVSLTNTKCPALVKVSKQAVPKLHLGHQTAVDLGEPMRSRIHPQFALHMVKNFALVVGGVKLRVRAKLQLHQSVADAVGGINERQGQHLQQTSLLVGIVCEV